MSQQPLAMFIGGSSGMGLETAKQLVQKGITVLILGRNQETLQSARADLETLGGVVETIQVDLYDTSAVDTFITKIRSDTRHIKYLVNAAGYFKPVSFWSTQ